MMKDDDFKMLKGFALRLTDGRTNEQTFAIVESLSRLEKLSHMGKFCKSFQCSAMYLLLSSSSV